MHGAIEKLKKNSYYDKRKFSLTYFKESFLRARRSAPGTM